MKVHTCEQGSREWLLCRLGRPTASQADRILTPAKLKPAAAATKYRNELLAEYILGHPIDFGSTSHMERGTEMEAEARAAYEFEHDVDVEPVGFVSLDDGSFGGSPDGLVGETGIFEAKCPMIHTHVGYLLDPASLEDAYRGQCQTLLMITGREWVDLWAYSPVLPPVRRRVEPDPKYIAAFRAALGPFVADLARLKEQLAEHKQTSILEATAPGWEAEPDYPEDLSLLGAN